MDNIIWVGIKINILPSTKKILSESTIKGTMEVYLLHMPSVSWIIRKTQEYVFFLETLMMGLLIATVYRQPDASEQNR